MEFLSIKKGLFSKGILSEPGDKFSAEITPTGKQIIRLETKETKRTIVRYPSTGKAVETIVHDSTER